jgi:EAL domain-containing protein (putative c-di-GMP-specific phosphodiesterase class I)
MRASIGVSLAPLHGGDSSTLLKRADIAMYSAKSTTKGVVVYDPAIDHNTTRRLVLASELRRAIAANKLEVWYQPVASLPTGDVTGFEALLRWHHDDFGDISPGEFIPVAEQTGLIEPLTWWMLRESLRELRRWHDNGYDVTLAVNLSARSLLDTEIADRFDRLLEETGVSPSSLEVEITESCIMADADRAERILRKLSALGISISIDDFGTGYSSLSRLKTLPVHTVKIDRSFVKNLCTDEDDEAIVRSTIELARNMGHRVVAEGVEDLETWDRLIELGCDHVQGYYLSRPLPADKCRAWMMGRQPTTLARVLAIRPALQPAARGA